MTRTLSANRKIITAQSKKDKLEAVDVNDLPPEKDVGVIGPGGKRENWKV